MGKTRESSSLAEKICVVSELGYLDDSQESRDFRRMYAALDDVKRAKIEGMIYGATAALHTEQTQERK